MKTNKIYIENGLTNKNKSMAQNLSDKSDYIFLN